MVLWPLSGRITSPFGDRTNRTSPHSGTDIYGPTGTAIRAGASGRVHHAGPHRDSFGRLKPSGNVVTIEYPVRGGTLTAMYCHVEHRYPVRVGQTVKAGREIAYVGTSGNSRGGHTHIECYLNGRLVNPEHYFGGIVPAGGLIDKIKNLLTKKENHDMRLIYNKDAPASQDTTRRAKVSDLIFLTITGPQSTRERKLWGAPVNFTQGEWDAQRDSVIENRIQLGLPVVISSNGSVGGSTDLKPVLDKLDTIPTAEQNGQAARTAIVKA